MTKRERIDYLDIAKGIGMLLVVIGHVDYVDAPIRNYIFSFHMPLFLFVSGMLLWYKQEEQKKWSVLIGKKARNLLLPYFLFSFLYLIIESVRLLVKGLNEWDNILKQLFQTICLQGISTLWFLPALFIGEVIFLWIRKNSSHGQTIWCLAVIMISVFFIHKDVQSLFAPYSELPLAGMIYEVLFVFLRNLFCVGLVGLGYYIGGLLFQKKLPMLAEAGMGIILLLMVGVIAGWNTGVNLRDMYLGNLAGFLFTGVAGTVGIVFLSRVLVQLPLRPIHRICEYFGRNSLLIMVTHVEFRILYLSIKVAAVINAVINKNIVFCSLIVLFVFLFEIVVIEFVNHVLPMVSKKQNKNL